MLLLRQTRGLNALFILSFSSLFLVILVILYLPANLIQSPACLLSLGSSSDSSVLSGACSSDLRNNGFDEDGVLVIGGVDRYEKEGDNDDEGVGAVGAGEVVIEFELESGLDPGTGYEIEAEAEHGNESKSGVESNDTANQTWDKGSDKTLGVASEIYVISLKRRVDRRMRMEELRGVLGLEWSYWDALDKDNILVEGILSAVRRQRELIDLGENDVIKGDNENRNIAATATGDTGDTGSGSSMTAKGFKWPESLSTLAEENLFYRVLNDTKALEQVDFSPGATSLPGIDTFEESPLLCATDDNTIPSYPPTAPIFNTTTINITNITDTNTNNIPKSVLTSIPFHMILSTGMIACWYSHASLIYHIVHRHNHITNPQTWNGKEGVVIIFEDDIDVEWDLKDQLRKMWANLPMEWDIIMLGHCWSDESTYPPIRPTSPLHPSYKPKCTHAYALSPFGARRILSYLAYPPFAFSRALDQAISHLIVSGRLRAYSVVPSIVIQKRCPTGTSIIECASLDRDEDLQVEDGKTIAHIDGDSDIWINEGSKGSKWKDSLRNSAFDRILYLHQSRNQTQRQKTT